MKSFSKEMLKVSAFYLEKQKSFVPKKKFSNPYQYQNKTALFTAMAQFSGKVLSDPIPQSFNQAIKNNGLYFEKTQEYHQLMTSRFQFKTLSLKSQLSLPTDIPCLSKHVLFLLCKYVCTNKTLLKNPSMNDTCMYVLTSNSIYHLGTRYSSFLTRQLSTTELKINKILVLDELIQFFGALKIF